MSEKVSLPEEMDWLQVRELEERLLRKSEEVRGAIGGAKKKLPDLKKDADSLASPFGNTLNSWFMWIIGIGGVIIIAWLALFMFIK
jgi:hypothetical protein